MQQRLPSTPTISVIVATRNRRAALEQFLTHVRQLPTVPAWELIVIDNGSSDDTSSLLTSAADDLPLVAIEEPRQGKSRALNKALRYARGELLLFADDDIVPDRLWLSAISEAAVKYPDANVFGGRILIDSESIPRWIVDSYNLRTILTTEQDLGDVVQWFPPGQYPVGPNIAIRRTLLDRSRYQWPLNLGPGTWVPLGDERAFIMQLSSPQTRDRSSGRDLSSSKWRSLHQRPTVAPPPGGWRDPRRPERLLGQGRAGRLGLRPAGDTDGARRQ